MKKTKDLFLEMREQEETEQDTAQRAYLESLKEYEIKSNKQIKKHNDEQK